MAMDGMSVDWEEMQQIYRMIKHMAPMTSQLEDQAGPFPKRTRTQAANPDQGPGRVDLFKLQRTVAALAKLALR